MANNKQSADTERCPIDLMDASSYVKTLIDSNVTLGLPSGASRDMFLVGANCGPAGCGLLDESYTSVLGSIGFKTPEDLLRRLRTAIKKKNKVPRVKHFSVNGSLSVRKGIKIQTVKLCKPTLSTKEFLKAQISEVGKSVNINKQHRTPVVQNGVVNYDLLEVEPLELEDEILQPVEFQINVQKMPETRAKSIVEPMASLDISCPKTENLGTKDIKPDVRLKLDINENALDSANPVPELIPEDGCTKAPVRSVNPSFFRIPERKAKQDINENALNSANPVPELIPEDGCTEAPARSVSPSFFRIPEKKAKQDINENVLNSANPVPELIPEDGCNEVPVRSVSPSSFRIPEKKAKLEDQPDILGFPIDSCTNSNLEQLSDEEVAPETATNCKTLELSAIAPQAEVLEADDDLDILELCVDSNEFD